MTKNVYGERRVDLWARDPGGDCDWDSAVALKLRYNNYFKNPLSLSLLSRRWKQQNVFNFASISSVVSKTCNLSIKTWVGFHAGEIKYKQVQSPSYSLPRVKIYILFTFFFNLFPRLRWGPPLLPYPPLLLLFFVSCFFYVSRGLGRKWSFSPLLFVQLLLVSVIYFTLYVQSTLGFFMLWSYKEKCIDLLEGAKKKPQF